MELANREQLETRLTNRVRRMSKPLRAKLDRLLGNPPNPANVPESFWQEVEDEARRELAIALLLIMGDATRSAGLPAELATEAAERYASQRADTFAGLYVDNSRRMLTQGDPAQRAEVIFGRGRAEGIGNFEVGSAQTETGKVWRKEVESRGGIVTAIWDHGAYRPKGHAGASKNPCPLCTPLLGKEESYWGRFYPNGPPIHPHDDCVLFYRVDKKPEPSKN